MNDIRSTFLCEGAQGRPATTNVHFVLDDNFSVAYGPERSYIQCTGAEEEMPLLRLTRFLSEFTQCLGVQHSGHFPDKCSIYRFLFPP